MWPLSYAPPAVSSGVISTMAKVVQSPWMMQPHRGRSAERTRAEFWGQLGAFGIRDLGAINGHLPWRRAAEVLEHCASSFR